MKIAIEFSEETPPRVFFEQVSLRVFPYILPPTRCFACYHLSHGVISCQGPSICHKCGSTEHKSDACSAVPCTLSCNFCKGNHATISTRCPIYREALKAAFALQSNQITKSDAAKHYASLYTKNSPTTMRSKLPAHHAITKSPFCLLPSLLSRLPSDAN